MKRQIINLSILSLCISILVSCEDTEMSSKEYPYFTMEKVDVLTDGALFQARVTNLGKQGIRSFGFVWNENNDNDFETWARKELTGAISGGTFSATINTDISQGEIYYVRPFIQTGEKAVYGPPVEFTGKGSKTPKVHDYHPKEGFDGTLVKLKGAYFSLRSQNISVFIMNILPAQIIRSTEDSLVFTIPESGANGWVQFRIVSGGQEVLIENAFNVLGPEITEISKNAGHSGDIITIRGHNFLQNGDPLVYFDGYQAEIIETGTDLLTVAVPVTDSPFSDKTVNITVRSGQKVSLPDIPFTIKKSWDIKTPAPFSWGWIYNAFSYNNKGYILETNTQLLYEYDPLTDNWYPGSSFPGDRDESNLFIVKENKLLKIGGIDHLGPVTNFWEYDFNTQVWTQKDDIPFTFISATNVSLNEEEYIITHTGQVWSYNHSSQLFSRKNDIPAHIVGFLFAFKDNNEIFFITCGSTWSYNISSDTWTEVSKNQFDKDSYFVHAIGFYSNGSAYVLEDGQDLYKYYRDIDRWILCGRYPTCQANSSYKTVFVIGEDAYIAALSDSYSGCSPFLVVYRD